MTHHNCVAGILLSVLDFQKRKKLSPELIGRKHPNPSSDKIVVQCANKAKPGYNVCGVHLRSKKIIPWNDAIPINQPTLPSPPPETSVQDLIAENDRESSSSPGEYFDSKGGVCESSQEPEPEPEPVGVVEEEIVRYGYCVPLDTPLLDWTMTQEEQSRWLVEVDTKKVYRIDDEGLGVEKGKLVLHPHGVIIGLEDERYMVELI